jgi:hypothetical protein
MNGPGPLALDFVGTLYVLNGSLNAVMEYANGGTTLTRVVTSAINGPEAMAVGPDGTLYVVNIAACGHPTITAYRRGTTTLAWTVGLMQSCNRYGSSPSAILLDSRNTLYVAETPNYPYYAFLAEFANGGNGTGENNVYSSGTFVTGPLIMGPP